MSRALFMQACDPFGGMIRNSQGNSLFPEREKIVDVLIEGCQHPGRITLIYGPVGIGKTTLLQEAARRYASLGRPCAYVSKTAHVSDVVNGLLTVYPEAFQKEAGRRRLRSRLRVASEGRPGLLILDHLSHSSASLKGFLRNFREAGQTTLIAVDTENERDHLLARSFRIADHELCVPPATTGSLSGLLKRETAPQSILSALSEDDRKAILRMAKGRPGWIVRVALRLTDPHYWASHHIRLRLLEVDVLDEVAREYMKRNAERSSSQAYPLRAPSIAKEHIAELGTCERIQAPS